MLNKDAGWWRGRLVIALGALTLALACQPLGSSGEVKAPSWAPLAKTWHDRALDSFQRLQLEDADREVRNALRVEPERPELRLLAARIALARLQFDDALGQLRGLEGQEALGLRARAHWYAGHVAAASQQLRALLKLPDVDDAWAAGVARLAESGHGREPFRLAGAQLGVAELLPHPLQMLLLPIELDGNPVLGLVATGSPEVVVDGPEDQPAWVSLRIGGKLEVKDVPALSRSLADVSEQVGAEVKVLLGVHLLRHINATFDYLGGQFVARAYVPPPPPAKLDLDLGFIRGGGTVHRAPFQLPDDSGAEAEEQAELDDLDETPAPDGSPEAAEPAVPTVQAQVPGANFLIDTGVPFPLTLGSGGAEQAGVDLASFAPLEGAAGVRQGPLPGLVLGGLQLGRVQAVTGPAVEGLSGATGLPVGGVFGAALLAQFRVTFTNSGRQLWLEPPPPPLPPLLGPDPEAG